MAHKQFEQSTKTASDGAGDYEEYLTTTPNYNIFNVLLITLASTKIHQLTVAKKQQR